MAGTLRHSRAQKPMHFQFAYFVTNRFPLISHRHIFGQSGNIQDICILIGSV